jgi:hypothetical protein
MDSYERKQAAKNRWNKKTYREITLRVHRGSDLDDRLGAYRHDGGSINYLIANLLSTHFGVDNPYKEIHTRKVVTLWPPKD